MLPRLWETPTLNLPVAAGKPGYPDGAANAASPGPSGSHPGPGLLGS